MSRAPPEAFYEPISTTFVFVLIIIPPPPVSNSDLPLLFQSRILN